MKKPTPRRLHLEIDENKIFVIRAGKTKHGPRGHWREWEYAQLAIQTLTGACPPKNIDRSKLTRDVNDWLDRNPEYRSTGLGAISRRVILRVLKDLLRRSS
jgi:hypothetical protein